MLKNTVKSEKLRMNRPLKDLKAIQNVILNSSQYLKFLTPLILILIFTASLAFVKSVSAQDITDAANSTATTETPAPTPTTSTDPALPPPDTAAPPDSTVSAPDSSASAPGDIEPNQNISDFNLRPIQISPAGNSGAAITNIPIVVPPGRKGIAPNLSLAYNSGSSNGWIGIGWSLDMGAIQRNTKNGVCYTCNDYVAAVNGSASELAPRGDWGANYYEAKIEGAFSKYYYNTVTGGWEVTTKEGTIYYYGTTAASRQDYSNKVFKWNLDSVQDTNGNYMTVSYVKDRGEIYLDRIDYTGNTAGLNPTNYVKFYRGSRTDAPSKYISNFFVITAYRLTTIEVYGNGQLSRKYILSYNYSHISDRSLLTSITQYGSDGVTSLPAISFVYTPSNQVNGITEETWTTNAPNWGDYYHTWVGDFDGDGKTDIATASGGTIWVKRSTGSSFVEEVWTTNAPNWGDDHHSWVGDFNGDGKTDIATASGGTIWVKRSTGTSFVEETWITTGNWGNWDYTWVGDFNGDGKADIATASGGTIWVKLSTGTSFIEQTWTTNAPNWGDYTLAGDFNGDGKTDIATASGGTIWVKLSTGTSFIEQTWTTSAPSWGDSVHTLAGDFNGDGKTDIATASGGTIWVKRSTGSSFIEEVWLTNAPTNSWGFFCPPSPMFPTKFFIRVGDFDGDGKTDIVTANDNNIYQCTHKTIWVMHSNVFTVDLLTEIDNSLGGVTTITYKPSSFYNNTLLPFIIQTLYSLTINDGNGNLSTTSFVYSGGYFDAPDREYRGFQYVKATAPNWATTESWFKQDDIYKGLPYDQITEDSSGNTYTRSLNTYNSTSPYTGVNFPYLSQKDDYVYDGTTTAKQASTSFTYDSYGNITRKYYNGDVAITGDERDENTEYLYDTANWMVSLPWHTSVKDRYGITKAQVWFTYTSDNKGNLWKKESWLEGGVNPVTTYTYDSYGNVQTITDSKQNPPTIITYDTTSYTYPVTMQNPLGHTIQKTYDYRFGKVLTETDPNTNTTTYEYDVFGRISKVTNPNDTGSTYGTMSYYYLNFGTVGSQRVLTYATEQSGTSNVIWAETYFDGLGRTIKTRAEGPDNKVIATQTIYNNRGLVDSASLPYFEGLETARYTYYEYDPIGRVTKITNPDGTFSTASYLRGTLTHIDANGHKKVEIKDVYGRLIRVEEYTGVYPTFSPNPAITTYEYDVLGNLTKVTDSKNNQTNITYDSLSRKRTMDDPDMGHWVYDYDANGNLTYQKDAKLQEIYFRYDELNRIRQKDYGTQKPLGSGDIVYTYDETFSTYPKGRLTTLTDNSGIIKFYYDKLGQTIKTVKTIDSTPYTTETTYDALGRTDTITYPDTTVIKNEYDTGGNLLRVKNNSSGLVYATYSTYNALGQVGDIAFLNLVTTHYDYYTTTNNRLMKITTKKGTQPSYIELTYNYDNVGNIKNITDYVDPSKTRNFVYDDMNRLIQASSTSYGGNLVYQYDKIGNMTYNCRYGYYYYDDPLHKHAVTKIKRADGTLIDSYSYDANGNMISGAGRTFTYDYDNRPTSIIYNSMALIAVYDANGNRVKKVTPTSTTVYIGQLYECTGGVCTKYIFAGSQRIAKIESTNTYYYHTDHLGSSSIITDQNGNSVQSIYYYPYGEIKTNTGSEITNYKFTGQEWDAETGLYYYGARYYDPRLARFISADTIVPDPGNPQSLNRYSYCANNPVMYIDPSGHFTWKHPFRHPFSGIGHFLDTAIAATVGFIVSGFNPVGAIIAATANVGLSHTGEGRRITGSVAKYFFDNFLGLPPDIAYIASSITLNAALSWGMWETYHFLNGTPAATIDTEKNVSKDFENNPEYSALNEGQGKSDFSGRNISDSGSAYRILDNNGRLVGVLGKADAFGLGVPGLEHAAISIEGADGIVNSMGDWKRGIIEFVTGTCHQAANQALLQAGYSLTVNGSAGWFGYVSAAIYGPYGSAAPALSYFDEERNRER